MTDSEIISGLLQLGEELLIKGDPINAAICTIAASKLMALPSAIEILHHPSAKVADTTTDDIDNVVRYMYGRKIGE
jgi:hypothetical protein